jgi:hypothetical protein
LFRFLGNSECDDTNTAVLYLGWRENEHVVAQFVEELRYKPEGRGFEYR